MNKRTLKKILKGLRWIKNHNMFRFFRSVVQQHGLENHNIWLLVTALAISDQLSEIDDKQCYWQNGDPGLADRTGALNLGDEFHRY